MVQGIVKKQANRNFPHQKNMNNLHFDCSERKAASAIGISLDTLKRWRLNKKIPIHLYTKLGYKTVRYCLPLLLDWQIAPDDLEAQSRAIAAVQSQRPSNQPQKRGRKGG
jgi:hypothetical protein